MKMPDAKYARTFPRAGRLVKMMFFSLFLWVCVLGLPFVLYMMFFGPVAEHQRWWAVGALACIILGGLVRAIIYATGKHVRW